MPRSNLWTHDELIAAFNLYCQIPFGRIHHRNPDIIALAGAIGRSPDAVSLKLANFASLDPTIRASGRKGMGNTSAADREVWDEFNIDWNNLVDESQHVLEQAGVSPIVEDDTTQPTLQIEEGKTRTATIQVRLKQEFFRRSVLSGASGQFVPYRRNVVRPARLGKTRRWTYKELTGCTT